MTTTTDALSALLAAVDDPAEARTMTIHIDRVDHRVAIFTFDRAAAARWAKRLGLDEPVRHGQPRELTTGIIARDWLSSGQWHGWHAEVSTTIYGERS
jgi:hypothetical protein